MQHGHGLPESKHRGLRAASRRLRSHGSAHGGTSAAESKSSGCSDSDRNQLAVKDERGTLLPSCGRLAYWNNSLSHRSHDSADLFVTFSFALSIHQLKSTYPLLTSSARAMFLLSTSPSLMYPVTSMEMPSRSISSPALSPRSTLQRAPPLAASCRRRCPG